MIRCKGTLTQDKPELSVFVISIKCCRAVYDFVVRKTPMKPVYYVVDKSKKDESSGQQELFVCYWEVSCLNK